MPPTFAKDFPKDAALDALVAAFDRGDFARVRREAPRLALASPSDEVRAAAEELARRTRPDRLSIVFFALTAALLVFLSGYWWWRAGGLSG
jgi:hypothetical protein